MNNWRPWRPLCSRPRYNVCQCVLLGGLAHGPRTFADAVDQENEAPVKPGAEEGNYGSVPSW